MTECRSAKLSKPYDPTAEYRGFTIQRDGTGWYTTFGMDGDEPKWGDAAGQVGGTLDEVCREIDAYQDYKAERAAAERSCRMCGRPATDRAWVDGLPACAECSPTLAAWAEEAWLLDYADAVEHEARSEWLDRALADSGCGSLDEYVATLPPNEAAEIKAAWDATSTTMPTARSAEEKVKE